MVGDFRDVVLSLPKRWEKDGKYIQPVKKVFPEVSLIHHGLKILVGGRNDPYISLLYVACTHRFVLAHFQYPQELPLDLNTQVRHIVQEECCTVGHFENACLILNSARKGPLDVSEQFAFQETG